MNNGGLFAMKAERTASILDQNNNEKKKTGKTAFIISLLIFIVILVVCLLYLAMCTPMFKIGNHSYSKVTESVGPPETSAGPVDTSSDTSEADERLSENPVNFSKQMSINDDIYAWIYIPNTDVNYPILQSNEDDLYYLRRDIKKNYSICGVVFTQSHNKKDFSDPVTLVYGHNMTGYAPETSMFATLHNFEDEEFFENNDTFYIYTPGHILTYKVVSAYKYDTRHIMNSFNFDDKNVVREYFDYVMNPMTIPMNVRKGVELKDDDKLVVLSTCMSDSSSRYLVNGVLVSDELTK